MVHPPYTPTAINSYARVRPVLLHPIVWVTNLIRTEAVNGMTAHSRAPIFPVASRATPDGGSPRQRAAKHAMLRSQSVACRRASSTATIHELLGTGQLRTRKSAPKPPFYPH